MSDTFSEIKSHVYSLESILTELDRLRELVTSEIEDGNKRLDALHSTNTKSGLKKKTDMTQPLPMPPSNFESGLKEKKDKARPHPLLSRPRIGESMQSEPKIGEQIMCNKCEHKIAKYSSEYEGQVQYFCCKKCSDKFWANFA